MYRSVNVGLLLTGTCLAALACSRAEDTPAPRVVANAGLAPVAVGDAGSMVRSRDEKDAAMEMTMADDDPRSCTFHMPEQSCIPGSDAVNFGCHSDCGGECTTCKEHCQATDGGGPAPAVACHDACLAGRDACNTKCPAQVAAFEESVRANHGCKAKRTAFAICTRTSTCIQACKDGDDENSPCRARCEHIHAAGCDRPFLADVEMGACITYDYSP